MPPAHRISAHDALRHPYFSTLPPPIMHLKDSEFPPPHRASRGYGHRSTASPHSYFNISYPNFFLFQPCPFSRCLESSWRRRSETCPTLDGGSNGRCCLLPSSGDLQPQLAANLIRWERLHALWSHDNTQRRIRHTKSFMEIRLNHRLSIWRHSLRAAVSRHVSR